MTTCHWDEMAAEEATAAVLAYPEIETLIGLSDKLTALVHHHGYLHLSGRPPQDAKNYLVAANHNHSIAPTLLDGIESMYQGVIDRWCCDWCGATMDQDQDECSRCGHQVSIEAPDGYQHRPWGHGGEWPDSL